MFDDLHVDYDKQWTTVTLQFPKTVTPQEGRISLKFRGTLNDKMKGFYRSSYKDATGKEQFIATTQFEVSSLKRSPIFWLQKQIEVF